MQLIIGLGFGLFACPYFFDKGLHKSGINIRIGLFQVDQYDGHIDDSACQHLQEQ